ncbi:MAG: helix-turn-helix transcriptional regulator, partial [Clostridiales bacterium]|nr:helix-turn-helix transcriptional regulator [Clostridiales bacterium]
MESARNIYKTARDNAGLTQEAAAERLNVAVETLRAYETNARRPADDKVADMVGLYNDQYL